MDRETMKSAEYTPSFDLPPLPRAAKAPSANAHIPPSDTSNPPSPAGYQILEEVGRGGMAVVYRARQLSLHRPVALKMLLGSGYLGAEDLLRFRSEADAVAQLQHSHIVQIHEVGECDGRPFLSLEFVDGGTLAQYLQGVPQSPTESAALLEELSRTMGFAHRQGIVHRDLKPSNILLQCGKIRGVNATDRPPSLSAFVPKISDFGLAKRIDIDDSRTRTGVIIGTPSYMAPEQAKGTNRTVGAAADIYALGAILYELLTGRPPFRGETLLDTLQYVLTQEPVPPSRLQPGVPRDLETICLKCLHKDAARRYATADELGDDLQRFRSGEPIHARRASLPERLVKWTRRRPTAAALVALSVLAAAALLIGGVKYNSDLGKALVDVKTERDKAVIAEKRTERMNLDFQREAGLNAADRGNHALASLWFAHAALKSALDEETSVPNRLRAQYWGRVDPTPMHVAPRMMAHLRRLVHHSAGRYLALVSLPVKDGVWAGVWDLERNALVPLPVSAERVYDLAWSPDGSALALGVSTSADQGEVVVLSFPELHEQCRLATPGAVFSLTFSPDSQRLAVAFGKSVQLLDLKEKQFIGRPWPHPHVVLQFAWSPDGAYLVTACHDGTARVFAAGPGKESLEPIYPPVPHVAASGTVVELSPPFIVLQGKGLVTVRNREELVLRELTTGKVLQTLAVPTLASIAASPDGSQIAIGGNRVIDLWDLSTKKVKHLPSEHRNTVLATVFSPDSDMLITASGDRTVSFWSVPQGKPTRPTIAQLNEVTHLDFSPDGLSLAVRQRDGLVRVLGLARDVVPTRRVNVGGRNTFVALDTQGRHFLPIGTHLSSGILNPRVYRLPTGEPAGPELETPGFVNGGTFSPDGRVIVLCGGSARTTAERDWARYRPDQQPGWIGFWDWSSGKALTPPIPTASEPLGVAYAPRDSRLIAVCAAGEIVVMDGQGAVQRRLQHGARTGATPLTRGWVSFSADGSRFVTSGLGRFAILWDAATLNPVARLEHEQSISSAAFSSDSRYLVTAARDSEGRDNSARVWDGVTGQPAAPPLRHPDWVFSARFSLDGRYVVTSCRDHSAKLWDWRKGEHVALEHTDEVFDAAFTSDGRWLLTASRDGTARIWDPTRPVCPGIPLAGFGYQIALTRDGATAVFAGEGGQVTLLSLREFFDTNEETYTADDLLLLAELHCGQRIQAETMPVNLTTSEWLQRWNAYRTRHPRMEGLVPAAAELRGWRLEQAERLERAKKWSAALTHLSALVEANPADWSLRNRRAFALMELQKYRDALEDLEVALQNQEREESIWRRRGLCLLRVDRIPEAIDSYTKAIALRSDQPYSWEGRGVARFRLKQWEPALADFRRAAEIRPSLLDSWLNQGATLLRLGRTKEAIAIYTSFIDKHPDEWRGWNGRAEAYARAGDLTKAAADGMKALQLQGKSSR